MNKARKPVLWFSWLRVVLLVAGTFTAGLAVLAQSPAAPGRGAAVPGTAVAGTGVARPAGAASQRPAFEVASIKPNHSGLRSGSFGWTGDRFIATNIPLKNLIEYAYRVKGFQLSGDPSWAGSEGYDIDAKVGDAKIGDAKIGSSAETLAGRQQEDRGRLMLQSLFATRFKLVLRQETKTLPVYRLAIAKSGPKLSAATGREGWREGTGQIKAQAITMATLAEILSCQLEREVMDETKLSGRYDLSLQWSPESGAAAPGMPTAVAQGDAAAPDAAAVSIFTAIQDQLGLKLKAAKAPVETLVIVHIERPSEN